MLAQQVRLICVLFIAYDIPFSLSIAVVMLNMGGPATVSQFRILCYLELIKSVPTGCGNKGLPHKPLLRQRPHPVTFSTRPRAAHRAPKDSPDRETV